MRGKPLVLKRLENGCIIPTSHKLNADGYFRYRLPNWVGKGRAPLVMYHRYVWEKARGANVGARHIARVLTWLL